MIALQPRMKRLIEQRHCVYWYTTGSPPPTMAPREWVLERNSGKLIRMLRQDGWVHAATKGSHWHRLADQRSDRIDESWYPLPLDEAEIAKPSVEKAARQDVLERIDALEGRLASLEDNPPVEGSNVQPWTAEPPPFSTDEYLRIEQILKSIQAQAGANEPDQSSLDEEASRLKNLAIGLGQWLRERRDAFADGFMKAAGVAVLAKLTGLYEGLVLLCQAVFHWITLLG